MANDPGLSVEPVFPSEGLASPYANSTYTFTSGVDVTIVFMRVPAMSNKQIAEAKAQHPYEAPVVTSVTLPIEAARMLLKSLHDNVGGGGPATS
jgi:hypothetical protein